MPNHRTVELELLLCAARTRLGDDVRGRIRALAGTALDWNRVGRLARVHGVVPIVARSLEMAAVTVPTAVARDLRIRSAASRIRAAEMTRELLSVTGRLERHGIQALALKGPVLAARAYGDPALRECVDLDVLVRRECFRSAAELLLADGYRFVDPDNTLERRTRRAPDHAITFRRDGDSSLIDLHRELVGTTFPLSLDVDRAWERRGWIDLGAGRVRCLHPADELVYLCVHAGKHAWDRLGRVCDVSESVSASTDLDWGELEAAACRAGASRMLGLGLLLASDLLDAPVPSAALARARNDRHAERRVDQALGAMLDETRRRADELDGLPLVLALTDGFGARARYLANFLLERIEPTALDADTQHLPRALRLPLRALRVARSHLLPRMRDALRRSAPAPK